jgi:hypothetical protein
MIWLVFLQFLVTAFSGMFGVLYLHIGIGLVVLVLAIFNYRDLKGTAAPDRVKRISMTIVGMAAFDGVLGVLLFMVTGMMQWTVNLLHLVVSVAVITQASSAATAYDMWEEKEFTNITA